MLPTKRVLQVLTEKNFNKTCFAEGAKSMVFFNDVEEDGERWNQSLISS